MLDLAVLIFLVTLGVELISWIGNDTLTNFVYPIFSTSPHSKKISQMKGEILKIKSDLAATNSQDEFAKWAKLRRKLDKGVLEYETLNSSIAGNRAGFATKFKYLLWTLTTVLPFVISSWHRKQAVFYLPPNWFGPATYFLALPSAPTGAIATGLWTMVCKRTIRVVKDMVVDLVKGGETPVAVPAISAETVPLATKKEL